MAANLLTVQGRVLSAPKIYYASNKEIQPQGESWNMRSLRFSKPAQLKNWTWIYIDPDYAPKYFRSPDALNASLKSFTEQLRMTGIAADMPKRGMKVLSSSFGDIEKARSLARWRLWTC